MKQLTMSYIDDDSKFLLHEDHNKIVRIGICSFHFIIGESFDKTIKRYLRQFDIPKKDLRKIKIREL